MEEIDNRFTVCGSEKYMYSKKYNIIALWMHKIP